MKKGYTWVRLTGLLAIVVAAGCQSYNPGPKFDPRPPQATNAFEPTFQTVDATNRLAPQLLAPAPEPFRLGPADKLEIDLLNDPNSRTVTSVGPDGKIYFGILPGVDVWGLTLSEAQSLLEKEMGKLLREKPEIAITLRGVESQKIWMLGRFQNPGIYPIVGPVTLLEAISAAGGSATLVGNQDPAALNSMSDLADLDRAFVIRQGKMLPVNFNRLLKEGDLSQNIYLQPDDFVYFPSAGSRDIHVMGAVAQPRQVPYSDGLTLAGAMAYSYGTLPDAYLSQVAIVRGSLTDPKIAIVDYKAIVKGAAPDVVLKARDIVYVPYTPWRVLSRYADIIATTFVSSVAINEGTRAVFKNPPNPAGIFIPFGSHISVQPFQPLPTSGGSRARVTTEAQRNGEDFLF